MTRWRQDQNFSGKQDKRKGRKPFHNGKTDRTDADKKKKLDCSSAEFLTVDEGLCVQIMHIGPFDDEPATVAIMDKYLHENGYINDITDTRLYHEIYLSDASKSNPRNGKQSYVIRLKRLDVSEDYLLSNVSI